MIETDSTVADAYGRIIRMVDFITRVELHGANAAEYATLHTQMTRLGFHTSIIDGEGSVFDLPTAMYLSPRTP